MEICLLAETKTPFHFGETITTYLANYRGTDWKDSGTTYLGNYSGSPAEVLKLPMRLICSIYIATYGSDAPISGTKIIIIKVQQRMELPGPLRMSHALRSRSYY